MRFAPGLALMAIVPAAWGGCSAPGPAFQPEAHSLLGTPLYAPALPEDVLLERSAQLTEAHRIYLIDPANENSIIWFGRRLAYLGRYNEAVEVFTEGLSHHPDSYRLLRHRGHRFITLRRLDDAIADLSRAAELVRGVPDATEPDGQPNARNIPLSTTHTNIFYHLGLAHYLKGEWEKSRQAYVKCLEHSKNDDMKVASIYWLVLNLHRLGLAPIADDLLADVTPEMEIIENFAYHKLLLHFKGSRTAEEVSGSDGDAIQDTTVAYGVAAWRLIRGDRDDARRRWRAIIAGDQWAAFGFIAAEAELARERQSRR